MPPTDRPQRRAFDSANRRSRSRRQLAIMAAAVAVFVVSFGYWSWDRQGFPRDGAPGWSPDGSQIVFMSEVGDRKGDIFVMNADGTGRRQLTDHDANDSTPSFSPDGGRIAFESDRDGNVEIYVMDVAGRNVHRLTNNPARDTAPAWSPDGKRIAFASDRDNRAAADLYLMNADGSGVERLSTDQAHWAPQFSPSGREVAVQINRDVWVIDLASKAKRQLTFEPANGMNPTWASDGSVIAFVSTRNRQAEIFVMAPDGSEVRRLVSMPQSNVIDPRWSPQGTQFAFVRLPDQASDTSDGVPAIYTMDTKSGRLTRLSR